MKTISAALLKKMLISGANNLYNHYPEIDQLNVFPVPDGDTGMNMNLTVSSGVKEIMNRPDSEDLYTLASGFSRGLLMGARGNSGVITSQIFRGFSKALKDKKTISAKELADAFVSAREIAYKAVMKPVEGTILTVIREASAALSEFATPFTSVEEAMDYFLEHARSSLARTPDLLPVLKEVGVVDSGGAGLVRILEGMDEAIHGRLVEKNQDMGEEASPSSPYAGAKLTEGEEGYGYCTQFILRLSEGDPAKKTFIEKNFKGFLSKHGNSVVIVRDEDIVKVHVHTLAPGSMLSYAQQFGEFLTITIENMSEEHHNIEHGDVATDMAANISRGKKKPRLFEEKDIPSPEAEEPRFAKKIALVAVGAGEGLDEIFHSLCADAIVSGGQTMNPAAEDFVKAIESVKAEHVFVLPNNSNIVMAASQACEILADSGIDARVVPSKTIPQGMVSALSFASEGDPEAIYEEMKDALSSVTSGSITYAIKDTDIEGVHITKGHYMAMHDKNIVSCAPDKMVALVDLLDALVNEDSGVITCLLGEDITPEEEEKANALLEEKYGSLCEIDVRRGGQPVYSFLVGVE